MGKPLRCVKQSHDEIQSTLLKLTVSSVKDWMGVGTGVQTSNAGGLDHGRNGRPEKRLRLGAT